MSLCRRPNSPYWWSKIYHAGDVVRFSTGERAKVKALRKERDHIADLERASRVEGRFTLATLAAKFIGWKEASARSEATIAALKLHVDTHILPFFGADADVRTIDRAALEEYKATRMAAKQKESNRPIKAQTVSKELSTIRGMLKYAVEVHQIIDAVPSVRSPETKYEPKWTFLTRAQLGALLAELAKRRSREVLPFFLLLANTGMRSGETRKMTWEMVDLPGRKIRLPATIRKNKRPLVIDINDGARSALMKLWRKDIIGRVFHQRDFRGALRVSCTNAKTPQVRPHDFRHTLASLLHDQGTPLPVVRDQLGHSTMHMVNLYAHSFDQARKQAVNDVSVMPLSTGKRKRPGT